MATRATVFGLDVSADAPLSLLRAPPGEPTGRALEIRLQAGDPAGIEWPRGAELISDQRRPDGSVNFQVEAHHSAGYLIAGPGYGATVLSRDGSLAVGRPGEAGARTWQRMLVAQVLPFAAVLRGLEVMHASAVVLAGRAIALLGASGSGKTSVALALRRQGAAFLADDVLSLERVGPGLIGHPGTAVAGVARADADRLLCGGSVEPGDVLSADERESVLRVAGAPAPAPVGSFFFLRRALDGPRQPRFEPVLDPRLLLAATFNLLLLDAGRLTNLLDVCSQACRGRVERVLAGPGVGPDQLAAAIKRRTEEGS